MKTLVARTWQSLRGWFSQPRVLWRSETPTQRTTIEIQQWAAFPLFLLALGWYIAAPSQMGMMVLVGLGSLLLGAFLWSLAMARGVTGERLLHFAAMQVGDELEEQISLRNKTLLPVLWAEFKDRSNIPGYTVSSARAADARSAVAWRAHTICTRRGVFNLGPWELTIGEPFGVLLVRQVYLEKQEILVYPPLAVLPENLLPHRGALGDHRPLNQPLRAETIASTSVRAFAPGDPLRHMHWPTTARRSEPFVKVFTPEAASNVWLVPDFDAAVHVGEGESSSEETMVTVAASLAAAMLQQHLSVGMFAASAEETVVLPRQGQAHLWTILQALAPLRAAPERPLESLLAHANALVSGSDLIVVITPSLKPDWVGTLRRVARGRGGGRAEVVLLDPASFVDSPQQPDDQEAEKFLTLLLEHGLPANLLQRDDVRLISGYYGEVSRWEFTVLGTGRALARKTPRMAGLLGEGAAEPGPKARGRL